MMQIKPLVVTVSTFFLGFSPFFLSAQQFDLSKVKPQIEFYHNSGQYNQEVSNISNKVSNYIKQRILRNYHHKKLAMVFDIDETSLSNYKAIMHGDFNTDANRYNHLLKGNDPAIPSILSLYKQAKKEGIALFFVTGRREKLCPSTKKNLHKEGFTQWTKIYCRPENDENPSIKPFKTAMRKKISEDGYVIIANIGDQKSDLKGGYAEQTYKLPNPFYYLP